MITNAGKDVEKKEPCTLLVGIYTVGGELLYIMENSVEFPQKN